MNGGIDDQVQQRVDAYRSKPQELQKSYAQNQQLIDLLALQKIKSEKDAVARQMQMQAQQTPQTIAQQREQEMMQRTKDEMVKQQAGVLQQRQQQAQKAQQQMLQGQAQQPQPQGIAGVQAPNMNRMADGGIVKFAVGGDTAREVDPTWKTKLQAARTPYDVQAAVREAKKSGATQEEINAALEGKQGPIPYDNVREGYTPAKVDFTLPPSTGRYDDVDLMGTLAGAPAAAKAKLDGITDRNAPDEGDALEAALSERGNDSYGEWARGLTMPKGGTEWDENMNDLMPSAEGLPESGVGINMPTAREAGAGVREGAKSVYENVIDPYMIDNYRKIGSGAVDFWEGLIGKEPEPDGYTGADRKAPAMPDPKEFTAKKVEEETPEAVAKEPTEQGAGAGVGAGAGTGVGASAGIASIAAPKVSFEDVADRGRDYYLKNAGMTPEERATREAEIAKQRELYELNNDSQQNKMDRLWATLAAAGGHGNIGYMGRDMVGTSQRIKGDQNQRAEKGLAALNKLRRESIGDVDIADRRSAAEQGLGFYQNSVQNAQRDRQLEIQNRQVGAQYEANQIAKISAQFSIGSDKAAKIINSMNEIRTNQNLMGATRGLSARLNELVDEIAEAGKEDIPRLTQDAADVRKEIDYNLRQIPEYSELAAQLERVNLHVDNLATQLASL